MNDAASRAQAMAKSTHWDYSALAQNYERRAPYAADAITALIARIGLERGASVLDVGAGTGRLTAMLLDMGLRVAAVEPNAAMRRIGIEKTQARDAIWFAAHGEDTGLADNSVELVTYGSSLNVLDRARALSEAARVLRPHGWMACLWNHRDLDDPLQRQIETAIRRELPDYDYGTRREDPTAVIEASGAFGAVYFMQCDYLHRTRRADFIDGFRAHATLRRQAGENFEHVLGAISGVVADRQTLDVPFTTRIWYAQRRAA